MNQAEPQQIDKTPHKATKGGIIPREVQLELLKIKRDAVALIKRVDRVLLKIEPSSQDTQ